MYVYRCARGNFEHCDEIKYDAALYEECRELDVTELMVTWLMWRSGQNSTNHLWRLDDNTKTCYGEEYDGDTKLGTLTDIAIKISNLGIVFKL